MNQDSASLIDRLRAATEGLLFQSESDFPLEPVHVPGSGQKVVPPDELARSVSLPGAAPLKKVKFDEFFANATEAQDWHGPEEKAAVKRFQELVKLMRENLADIKVFKFGKVEIDVCVIGRTPSGDFVGIKTRVVES